MHKGDVIMGYGNFSFDQGVIFYKQGKNILLIDEHPETKNLLLETASFEVIILEAFLGKLQPLARKFSTHSQKNCTYNSIYSSAIADEDKWANKLNLLVVVARLFLCL
jgi:predicted nucleic-acid-binding Zn-ribbon protein